MKIFISSDHGGFDFKETIKAHLTRAGHDVVDVGNTIFDPVDHYPEFIIPMAEKVVAEPGSLGIVLGRSGNGEAIAANKVKGVRAALCLNETMAEKAREHNNANVLALGGDYIDEATALRLVDIFIATPFSIDERHRTRIDMMSDYESRPGTRDS